MAILEQFWEDLGNRSPATIKAYRVKLGNYMKYFYPDGYDREKLPEYVERYFSEHNDHFSAFKNFLKDTQKDAAPLTAGQSFKTINNFLRLCDVVFTEKQIRQLKNQLPTGGVLTMEDDLDTETIRNILLHTDVKGKALILCLASGGMRIGELLQIRCEDVDLVSIPAVLKIRPITKTGRTKNGEGRIALISSEATAAVREWIKVREKYLQSVSNKGLGLANRTGKKSISDDRLFPFSQNTAGELWKAAVSKTFGEDKKDVNSGMSTRHIHMLRKFFLSQLSLSISKEISEVLCGHAGYLTSSYRRYTVQQLKDEYLKGEHQLYIEAVKEIRESATTTKKELIAVKDDQQKANSQMIALMIEKDRLREENARLREEQKGIVEQMQELTRRVDQFASKRTAERINDALADLSPEQARQFIQRLKDAAKNQ